MDNQEHVHKESLLWIYARPGAGKTVLSSRLIDHYISENMGPHIYHVLYFFCKNIDTDKNTSASVMLSLLYQLNKSTKDQVMQESLTEDIGRALDRSGQRRVVNFATMWQLFLAHVKNLPPTMIILDALDECQDPDSIRSGLYDSKPKVTVHSPIHKYHSYKPKGKPYRQAS